MSIIEDTAKVLGEAAPFIERAAPFLPAFERLLPLLLTGELTESQLNVAVEAVMLSAKREQIRREG